MSAATIGLFCVHLCERKTHSNYPPPRRSPLMFPSQIWNVYEVTLEGGDRTNNVCEGFNHGFNVLVGQRHPPFFAALEAIQKDHIVTKRNLLRSQRGIPLTQRVRQDVRNYNRNVTNLCVQYANNVWQRDMLGYLRRISYNIRFR